jgi:hypothetical protein
MLELNKDLLPKVSLSTSKVETIQTIGNFKENYDITNYNNNTFFVSHDILEIGDLRSLKIGDDLSGCGVLLKQYDINSNGTGKIITCSGSGEASLETDPNNGNYLYLQAYTNTSNIFTNNSWPSEDYKSFIFPPGSIITELNLGLISNYSIEIIRDTYNPYVIDQNTKTYKSIDYDFKQHSGGIMYFDGFVLPDYNNTNYLNYNGKYIIELVENWDNGEEDGDWSYYYGILDILDGTISLLNMPLESFENGVYTNNTENIGNGKYILETCKGRTGITLVDFENNTLIYTGDTLPQIYFFKNDSKLITVVENDNNNTVAYTIYSLNDFSYTTHTMPENTFANFFLYPYIVTNANLINIEDNSITESDTSILDGNPVVSYYNNNILIWLDSQLGIYNILNNTIQELAISNSNFSWYQDNSYYYNIPSNKFYVTSTPTGYVVINLETKTFQSYDLNNPDYSYLYELPNNYVLLSLSWGSPCAIVNLNTGFSIEAPFLDTNMYFDFIIQGNLVIFRDLDSGYIDNFYILDTNTGSLLVKENPLADDYGNTGIFVISGKYIISGLNGTNYFNPSNTCYQYSLFTENDTIVIAPDWNSYTFRISNTKLFEKYLYFRSSGRIGLLNYITQEEPLYFDSYTSYKQQDEHLILWYNNWLTYINLNTGSQQEYELFYTPISTVISNEKIIINYSGYDRYNTGNYITASQFQMIDTNTLELSTYRVDDLEYTILGNLVQNSILIGEIYQDDNWNRNTQNLMFLNFEHRKLELLVGNAMISNIAITDTLDIPQREALDSGITASKVNQYDEYSDNINNIFNDLNNKQYSLNSQQNQAINSGITYTLVNKFNTYETGKQTTLTASQLKVLNENLSLKVKNYYKEDFIITTPSFYARSEVYENKVVVLDSNTITTGRIINIDDGSYIPFDLGISNYSQTYKGRNTFSIGYKNRMLILIYTAQYAMIGKLIDLVTGDIISTHNFNSSLNKMFPIIDNKLCVIVNTSYNMFGNIIDMLDGTNIAYSIGDYYTEMSELYDKYVTFIAPMEYTSYAKVLNITTGLVTSVSLGSNTRWKHMSKPDYQGGIMFLNYNSEEGTGKKGLYQYMPTGNGQMYYDLPRNVEFTDMSDPMPIYGSNGKITSSRILVVTRENSFSKLCGNNSIIDVKLSNQVYHGGIKFSPVNYSKGTVLVNEGGNNRQYASLVNLKTGAVCDVMFNNNTYTYGNWYNFSQFSDENCALVTSDTSSSYVHKINFGASTYQIATLIDFGEQAIWDIMSDVSNNRVLVTGKNTVSIFMVDLKTNEYQRISEVGASNTLGFSKVYKDKIYLIGSSGTSIKVVNMKTKEVGIVNIPKHTNYQNISNISNGKLLSYSTGAEYINIEVIDTKPTDYTISLNLGTTTLSTIDI